MLFLMLSAALTLSAQGRDDIVGTFVSHDKDLRVEIYRDGKLYQGVAVWSGVSSDYEGAIILRNLCYDADSREYTGKIFDPRFDKEYNVKVVVETDGNLRVCPWWGLVKMKFVWTRSSTDD